jgi:hypothetical protein
MQNNYQIDIKPILNDVSDVINRGINNVLYDFTVRHLTNELEKCRNEMDKYKPELENIRKYYGVGGVIDPSIKIKMEPLSDNGEHIFLNINENEDTLLEEEMEEEVVTEEVVEEEEEEMVEEAEEEEEVVEEEEEEMVEEAEEEEMVEEAEEDVDDIETENEEEEEEEEEGEEEEESTEEDAEEIELIEIDIDDVTYYAENEDNGPIYEIDSNGDPGNQIGHIKDGEPFFST